MNFVDKQTLDDLHIFGKRGNSIYQLFNTTHTRGGAQLLEDMFLCPMADLKKISRRSSVIQFFAAQQPAFPFRNEAFDAIEHYFENADERTKLNVADDTLQRKLRNMVGADAQYELLHKGIVACVELFNELHHWLQQLNMQNAPQAWREEVNEIQRLLASEQLAWMHEEKDKKKLTYAKVAQYDQVLRFALSDVIKKLLYHIYTIDVYIAVGRVAATRSFTFPVPIDTTENTLRITEMYHPYVANAVANSLQVDRNSNVIFLTGANMAGKSTFMKTLGVILFLAHMGFPVPAKQMEFTVQEGLFTTINLADNLNMGYSHFYAEVLRLKKVAEHVNRSGNMVIIFDELFRGTNVKDAYDATVAVTTAFAEKRNCTFVISTHIIEAGEELKTKCDNINFVYFPTTMNGPMPTYTYRLASGITNDRHGMMIINNENIIAILKSRQQSLKTV